MCINRNHLTCFLCLFFLSFISVTAQGPDLIEESFDYEVGLDLDGLGTAAGGWDGPWEYAEGNPGNIIVYPGTILGDLPAQRIGNYVELTTETGDAAAYRYILPAMNDTGQTFWISLLYQRIDAGEVLEFSERRCGVDSPSFIGRLEKRCDGDGH